MRVLEVRPKTTHALPCLGYQAIRFLDIEATVMKTNLLAHDSNFEGHCSDIP